MPRRLVTLILVIPLAALSSMLAVACGDDEARIVVTSSEATFVPLIESSDIYVGVPRIVLTLLERDGQPEFPEDARLTIRYFAPTEDGIRFDSEAELSTIDVEGLRYLIAEAPPFIESGAWALAVTVELPDGGAESSPRLPFQVSDAPRGLRPGDPAPLIDTPTITDNVLERLAPQSVELRALYARSAAELLAAGEPFLIVWTSADRCGGRLACARALQQAIEVLQRGEIAVIHVEPFGRPRQPTLQALIDAANEAWRIEAEPQLFTVDRDGMIAAHFGIVVETAELQQALEAVRR